MWKAEAAARLTISIITTSFEEITMMAGNQRLLAEVTVAGETAAWAYELHSYCLMLERCCTTANKDLVASSRKIHDSKAEMERFSLCKASAEEFRSSSGKQCLAANHIRLMVFSTVPQISFSQNVAWKARGVW